MSERELIERACETIEGYLALGNERLEACGATFIRNRTTPSRYDANHVGLIRDASSFQAMLARADIEYAHLDYRQFDIDPLTPPEVEAGLGLAGFSRWSAHLVMVLDGELKASPMPYSIREVVGEDAWQAFGRLQAVDHLEYNQRLGRPSPEPSDEWLAYTRAKSPAARTWLAYIEDVAAGYFTSWPGRNGVGQVEDLFTHPDHRHRGIATTLIAHCTADARQRGAGPVLISADAADTPKQMYADMGFRPLFVARSQYR